MTSLFTTLRLPCAQYWHSFTNDIAKEQGLIKLLAVLLSTVLQTALLCTLLNTGIRVNHQ